MASGVAALRPHRFSRRNGCCRGSGTRAASSPPSSHAREICLPPIAPLYVSREDDEPPGMLPALASATTSTSRRRRSGTEAMRTIDASRDLQQPLAIVDLTDRWPSCGLAGITSKIEPGPVLRSKTPATAESLLSTRAQEAAPLPPPLACPVGAGSKRRPRITPRCSTRRTSSMPHAGGDAPTRRLATPPSSNSC